MGERNMSLSSMQFTSLAGSLLPPLMLYAASTPTPPFYAACTHLITYHLSNVLYPTLSLYLLLPKQTARGPGDVPPASTWSFYRPAFPFYRNMSDARYLPLSQTEPDAGAPSSRLEAGIHRPVSAGQKNGDRHLNGVDDDDANNDDDNRPATDEGASSQKGVVSADRTYPGRRNGRKWQEHPPSLIKQPSSLVERPLKVSDLPPPTPTPISRKVSGDLKDAHKSGQDPGRDPGRDFGRLESRGSSELPSERRSAVFDGAAATDIETSRANSTTDEITLGNTQLSTPPISTLPSVPPITNPSPLAFASAIPNSSSHSLALLASSPQDHGTVSLLCL